MQQRRIVLSGGSSRQEQQQQQQQQHAGHKHMREPNARDEPVGKRRPDTWREWGSGLGTSRAPPPSREESNTARYQPREIYQQHQQHNSPHLAFRDGRREIYNNNNNNNNNNRMAGNYRSNNPNSFSRLAPPPPPSSIHLAAAAAAGSGTALTAAPIVAKITVTTDEERKLAADMVRIVLPHWNLNTDGRAWAFDPRSFCWSPYERLAPCASSCSCSCPLFQALPTLTPTLLHHLLPKAMPALYIDLKKNRKSCSLPPPPHSSPKDLLVQEEEEEDVVDYSLDEIVIKDEPDAKLTKTSSDDEVPSFFPFGKSSDKLAFRNGVLVLSTATDDDGVFHDAPTVLCQIAANAPNQTDHTCAFPFDYEPFRPAEDLHRMNALRRLLFDRFWGREADDFLAYLASSYFGGGRGRMVVSSPEEAPLFVCCSADDDPTRYSSAQRHYTAARACWEKHRNTGPQYLERLLALVHGEYNVRGGGAASTTSHVSRCDYERFTRSSSVVETNAFLTAHRHQRLLWCRPAESDLMFYTSRHQPDQPAFGPVGNRDRAVATLRKTQMLARIDAPRTLQFLQGVKKGDVSAATATGTSFCVFLLWPLPTLPALDGYVQRAAEDATGPEYINPLAPSVRSVNHTAWSPEDVAALSAPDWSLELDAVLNVSNGPDSLSQLRRCWVELVRLQESRNAGGGGASIWDRTHLSEFAVNSLGYPGSLQEQTAIDGAMMEMLKRSEGMMKLLAEDAEHRGLRQNGWAHKMVNPTPKLV